MGRGWLAKPRPATLSPRAFDSLALRHRPRGCSSEAEQPAFNRQARVRLPVPAPWSQFRRGVVEWPQTAGFEPVHTGSNPVTPAIQQPLSSEAEQRSYKAKVDVS